ncbi:winged helix-turn-helix domain-containing protein [Sphingomonas sp. DG1-23]|uniref:winged helix-turn-helix domain-containing protein n=1 Tax=Sphingomonas sp. DG1-23 TaxID=3068316 RepID=UPI00273E1AD4|nr:winged helix-turn-helix domain-containing protein [Sphingomonas sp. DG1-23]
MTAASFRFDRFRLDTGDRQLRCDDAPVELNGRYFDALVLLVREAGTLVSKDRFFGEVWRGVPVTDEALTQCIRTLRRQLGDSAVSPRFIETVPKHGYRFIAPVEPVEGPGAATPQAAAAPGFGRALLLVGGAGTLGAGGAGVIGGLIYGFIAASQPLQPGIGTISVLLVLLCATTLVALLGGAGVAFGIAAAEAAAPRSWLWRIAGGAGGGLLVGAIVKLLGLDAFSLLLGQSPGDITGAGEGALLGGAVGLANWLAVRARSTRRGVAIAALAGGAGGVTTVLLGGRLMAGSLDLLARALPGSRLRLDAIGRLLGETGFGPVSQSVTAGLEGALFGGCIAGAMLLARHGLRETRFIPR